MAWTERRRTPKQRRATCPPFGPLRWLPWSAMFRERRRREPGKRQSRSTAQRHVIHAPGSNGSAGSLRSGGLPFGLHGVDYPHNHSANQQGSAHHVKALQVLSNDLSQQKRWDRSDNKGYGGETERMSQDGAVPAFSPWKRRDELHDARPEVDGKTKNCAQLD